MFLTSQYDHLLEIISEFPGAVAFSGGIDSTLVLKALVDVHGHTTMAFFVDSDFQPHGEMEDARKISDHIGCDFKVVRFEPLALTELVSNPVDRCYHCKKEIYSNILKLLPSHLVLMDGSNLDDLTDFRPGKKALSELGIHTPLIKAGLHKEEIRSLAKRLRLPNWNRLSASCLATRLPSGMKITRERLHRVAACEAELNKLGFSGCRVRLVSEFGNQVKLELLQKDFEKILDRDIRKSIIKKLSLHSAERIYLDLSGR